MIIKISVKNADAVAQAFRHSPQKVSYEVSQFLTKAMSYLNQTLLRNPWRIGMSGGGVPVKTGNLRDTHRRTMTKMGFTIQPTANYAQHVHKKRPWLVYAATKNEKKVEKAAKEMLDAIARSLTK